MEALIDLAIMNPRMIGSFKGHQVQILTISADSLETKLKEVLLMDLIKNIVLE